MPRGLVAKVVDVVAGPNTIRGAWRRGKSRALPQAAPSGVFVTRSGSCHVSASGNRAGVTAIIAAGIDADAHMFLFCSACQGARGYSVQVHERDGH